MDNLQDLTNVSEIEGSKMRQVEARKKEVVKTIGFSIKKDERGKVQDEFNKLNASFIINDDDDDFSVEEENEIEDEPPTKELLQFAKENGSNDNENDLYASINQYKLKFLGSVRGMNEFKNFLRKEATNNVNSGYRLLKFWLDCEFYRDSMQDYDEIENMATRNRLYRDLIEKYVFHFARKVILYKTCNVIIDAA